MTEPSHTATRRQLLKQVPLAIGGAALMASSPTMLLAAEANQAQAATAIRYCLNTSTIQGQKLPLPQIIDLVGKAGYDGIEPWIRELRSYVEGGGKLADLRRQIDDAGLTVDSAIGFANWIVDDDAERAKGLESMRSDMELLREIGGTRIAAPPVGVTQEPGLDLAKAAERYAAVLELGRQTGVTPQLELWGFSANLSRLGELAYVAIEAGDPSACLLPDVYHIYKGGSDFQGLQQFNGASIQVMHLNDYPDLPRETISDADRVYPGDGVAPLSEIIRTLVAIGFRGTFSLELFNRSYWQRPPEEVIRVGLAKMKTQVEGAFQG